MAPKHKSSDAGSSDLPRSHKVLPLREKVKVLDFTRKEKKYYAEVAKIYRKSKSSIHEIVKNQKEMHVTPHAVKVMATAHKCLVKMEKVLNLYSKIL